MSGDVNKENKVVIIDAFGVPFRACPTINTGLTDIDEWDLVLNKETGEFVPTIVGKTSLFEIIQSNKDNCGLKAALLAISKGENAIQFADDGQHSGDASNMKDNVNDAYREAIKAGDVSKKLLKALGLDGVSLNSANLDETVKAAVIKLYGEKGSQTVADKAQVVDEPKKEGE